MEQIPLLVAFTGGLLSFLSPCILPLVPVYLASLYGPDIFEAGNRNRVPVFLHALSFVVGFAIVFTLLGIAAGATGFAVNLNLTLIQKISGSLLLAFGVFMLVALKVPWLNYEKRFTPKGGIATGYLRSFLTGAIFTVAWTPCIGPILGSIMTIAWASETAARGGYLLAVYSLGLGLPFLIIGIAFDSLTPLLKRINRYSNIIYIISGILLIVMGILIIANKLTWLQTL